MPPITLTDINLEAAIAKLSAGIARYPLIIAPTAHVVEAIALMSAGGKICSFSCEVDSEAQVMLSHAQNSCVLVVEDNQLVGIVTECDLVRLRATAANLTDLLISEVMISPVLSLEITKFKNIFVALEIFQRHQIRHLPLVDEHGVVVGLLTHDSLRQLLRPIDLLHLRVASEVMTTQVIHAQPTATILELTQLMTEHRVSSVVIVETEKNGLIPRGIVTERDIVQFLALELDFASIQAQVVMSTPVFSLGGDMSLWSVRMLMQERQINRIVVTDAEGRLLGIVTQTNLLNVLNPTEIYRMVETLEEKVSRLESEKLELLQARNIVLETQVQERTTALKMQVQREKLLAKVSIQLRSCFDLQEILKTTVREVRGFLKCDRLLVYQFASDFSGTIVAESVGADWAISINDHIEDSCFQQQTVALYGAGRTVAINNIDESGYAECHLQLLKHYQVKANLVVPILVSGALWGLLIGHNCADYRTWNPDDLRLLDEIAVQLAIAIQQATVHQIAEVEIAERQKAEIALKASETRLAELNQKLEIKVAERTAALQESQQFIEQIANASPNILYVYDVQQECNVYVNREISTGLGYTPEAVQAMKSDFFKNVMHPDDWLRVPAQYELYNTAQDGEILEFEYRMQHANGEWRWLYSRDLVFKRDENGKVKQTIGTAEDITDRKRLEEEQQRLIAILQGSTDYIGISDAAGNILWNNTEFKRLWGLADDAPIQQRKIADYHSQWSVELIMQQGIPNAIANGNWVGETALLTPQGEEIPTSQLIIAHKSPQGEIEFFSTILRDMRVHKEYERKLERSNAELTRATRLKDEFLANMSHELRTPLNAILGMSETLQEEIFGLLNERQQKLIATIETSGQHLLELINDILDVSKIEAGKLELNMTPVSVIQLCKSSLAFVKQQAIEKSIKLKSDLQPDLGDIIVDERRMRQVLINLLNNAVKFTPNGGQVNLRVYLEYLEVCPLDEDNSPTDSEFLYSLCFSIIDTGIGIAPADQNKLFQPFIQIDSSLNRKYAGTGLGLTLVKQIVELHGASIIVTSELDKGSCFTVRLPYIRKQPVASILPSTATSTEEKSVIVPPKPLTNRPLILIAEDNQTNVDTIWDYLEACGYDLILATNGQEAIDMTITHSPHLILMDIQMPGMDGLEAMRQIRTNPQSVSIPIIALTALAMSGDKEKCLNAGANEYLSKPIKLKQLTEMIKQML